VELYLSQEKGGKILNIGCNQFSFFGFSLAECSIHHYVLIMRSKHTLRLQIQEDIIFDFLKSEMGSWVDEVVDFKKKGGFHGRKPHIFFENDAFVFVTLN
jgi:hypothetical protein